MTVRTRTVLVALSLLLAGCGAEPTPAMDDGVRAMLRSDVAAVKSAAQRQDRDAAEAALSTLTRDVARAQAQGSLQPQRARTILAAADRVLADVQLIVPPPPPPPPPPAPEPTPEPERLSKKQLEELRKAQEELQKQREEWEKKAEEKQGDEKKGDDD